MPAPITGVGRLCQLRGHEVRLISPQFVKPFVKSNKNGRNDARAICEAAQRPDMHFVPVKTIEQQAVLSLHRVREMLIGQRTATINQLRGLLTEFGLTTSIGRRALHNAIPAMLEDLMKTPPIFLVSCIRQHSTGGKPVLLGTSKRGDSYLRKLLVHGARAVMAAVRSSPNVQKQDKTMMGWLARKHMNVAVVAMANRNARIAWVMMTQERDFDRNFRDQLANQLAAT